MRIWITVIAIALLCGCIPPAEPQAEKPAQLPAPKLEVLSDLSADDDLLLNYRYIAINGSIAIQAWYSGSSATICFLPERYDSLKKEALAQLFSKGVFKLPTPQIRVLSEFTASNDTLRKYRLVQIDDMIAIQTRSSDAKSIAFVPDDFVLDPIADNAKVLPAVTMPDYYVDANQKPAEAEK